MKLHGSEIDKLSCNVWSDWPRIHSTFHLPFLKHFALHFQDQYHYLGHNLPYNYFKRCCWVHTHCCKAATIEVTACCWDFKKKKPNHHQHKNANTDTTRRHVLATITRILQTSLLPMFCFAKQVHLLEDSDGCCILMDGKTMTERGAFILYRDIKLSTLPYPFSSSAREVRI